MLLGACERREPDPISDALSVIIPHPGYLDECAPRVALRPGQQRRVDFECGGVGLLNENQFWWRDCNELADIRIKVAREDVMICGLCGCGFGLTFTTPVVHGQLTSMPGRECGKFRRYHVRIQRPRQADSPDPWSVSLDSPSSLPE